MNSKQNFIKGTIVLMVANAISKMLGAIFKIPLTYVLHEEGMAIFNTAMNVYSIVLSFIISGFPLSFSRLISTEFAMNNHRTVKKTVKISALIFAVLGLIGSLILYLGADFFAYAMKDPKSTLAIKVISPSVFLVALGNVFKCYFQGSVNMIPTAISQVIESFVRLILGFGVALYLNNTLIEITSAGAISGITIGELIATLVLFLMFIPSNKKLTDSGELKSNKSIIHSIFDVAFPMLICSLISCGINLVDTSTIRNALLNIKFTPENVNLFLLRYSSYTTHFDYLKDTLKMTIDGARWLYGAYSGYALTIFNLPIGIISALTASIFPVISGAFATKNINLARKTILSSLQITVIIILPCALMISLFSNEILNLLFKNTASAHLLTMLSPALVFICITNIFIITLHSMGKIFEPFLYSLIGMIVKLTANVVLIPIPIFNISGAIIGSTLAYFIIMILDIRAVIKYTSIRLSYINTFIKPILSVLCMSIIVILLKKPLNVIFLNEITSLLICSFAGVLGYILALISTDCIDIKKIKKS